MVKTINQSYQAKYIAGKRKRIIFKVLLWFFVFVAVIGGTVYFLFFSKIFYVKEIAIANSGFIGNQEITNTVDDYLAQKKFFVPRFSNLFFVDADYIQKLLSDKFPQAENIRVEKNYFHTLKISLDKREAVGSWCFQKENKCFYFDRKGIAFDTAAGSSGSFFLSVEDQNGQFEKLGQIVADSDLLNFILNCQTELDKLKINLSKFVIPAGENFRLDAQTLSGWKIYFSTSDDLKDQINTLNTFLSQKVSSDKRDQLQYIDLRIPNRVYYK